MRVAQLTVPTARRDAAERVLAEREIEDVFTSTDTDDETALLQFPAAPEAASDRSPVPSRRHSTVLPTANSNYRASRPSSTRQVSTAPDTTSGSSSVARSDMSTRLSRRRWPTVFASGSTDP